MSKIRNYFHQYQKIPVQAKAAMWFTICSVLQKGLHMLTMPLFTRILTTEQYGLSTLYFAWMDIIVIFTSLKLASGVFNNGMIYYQEDRDRFQASMQGLSTVSAILCMIIYFLFPAFFQKLLGLSPNLILSMLIYAFFYPSLLYWTARQRFEYRYIGFTLATVGMSFVTTLVSVLFTFFEDKGTMKIIGYVTAATAVNLVFYIYLFVRGKIFFHREYWTYALKFNLPLIPHYLSMIILNQCDRIMIANMCGETEAGIYGVAYTIGKTVLLFNSAITASFTPWMYEKLKTKRYEGIPGVSVSLFVLIAVLGAGVMLFAPEVIMIFATQEYMQAVYAVPPITAGGFFTFVYNQVSTVEFYYGKSKYIMVASVAGAILNLFLNYVAIQWFGFIAAAYTSMFCYILFAVCHYFLMRLLCRKNGISVNLFPGKRLALLSAVMIIITVGVNFFYQYNLIRYGLLLVMLGLTAMKRKKILLLWNRMKEG